MDFKKYSFSFTAASSLTQETLVIAEEYERLKDWQLVKDSVIEKNLLNKIKVATINREFREVKKRLLLLTSEQFNLLISGNSDDAGAMVIIGLVKTYSFLKDFIIEVIRNKYLVFDRYLLDTDYTKFFNNKFLFHPELESLTEITVKKVKQVIFRILDEVALIARNQNNVILKPVLSNQAIEAIISDDPSFLNCFLYSNDEIKALAQNLKNV